MHTWTHGCSWLASLALIDRGEGNTITPTRRSWPILFTWTPWYGWLWHQWYSNLQSPNKSRNAFLLLGKCLISFCMISSRWTLMLWILKKKNNKKKCKQKKIELLLTRDHSFLALFLEFEGLSQTVTQMVCKCPQIIHFFQLKFQLFMLWQVTMMCIPKLSNKCCLKSV